MKKTVYWIVRSECDYPRSEDWTNDLYVVFPRKNAEQTPSFRECVEMASENFRRERPFRYAVVVDTDDTEELKIVNGMFLSNNVIRIGASRDMERVKRQIGWIMSDYGREPKEDDSSVFFCSDLHFNHGNIIRYCDRPWNSGRDENGEAIVSEDDVKRMNEDMIANWNSVVGKDSTVWFLGDFCLGRNQNEEIPRFVSRLNGRINLVMGNHDRHSVKFYYDAGFHRVYDRPVVIKNFIILSHSPLEFVKAPFFNIYGHVHSTETYKTWSKDCCCACVERHNYRPISLSEVKMHREEEQ